MKRFKEIILLVITVLILTSCDHEEKKSDNQYLGQWELQFKELPVTGDMNVKLYLEEKDSLMVGYFLEEDGKKVDFKKISVDSKGFVRVKYEWGGHKVGFKIKTVENNKDSLVGSFMGMFDIEGVRVNGCKSK